MPRTLSKQLTIAQADGTLPHRYDILENDKKELQWFEGSDSEDTVRAGQPVVHKWDFFGGGACETVDMGKGGYFFCTNCTVCNPFRIRPRPETASVTLTGNTSPVTRFFEEQSASGAKFLYAIVDTPPKIFKIKLLDRTLLNTRAFSSGNTSFKTGSYVGDGTASQAITGVGFQPKAVIIKAHTTSTEWGGVIGTDTMASGSAKSMDDAVGSLYGTGYIGSLDTNGFTVGSSNIVNENGKTYSWMAFAGDAAYTKTGSFTGNATDDRDITIDTGWGQPDALFLMSENSSDGVVFRTKTVTADLSWDLIANNGGEANLVEATADWPADGFEVGDDNRVNRNAATIHYLALKQDTNIREIGSYTGDGVDPQAVTGLGFEPTYLIIVTNQAEYPVHRSDTNAGDSTMYFRAAANTSDRVQSLDSDGFSVGGDDEVNKNTETYYYLACKHDIAGTPVLGTAARWNDIWELGCGSSVAFKGLTIITDDATNDTWTARTGLYAQCFQIVRNKLARSYSDRSISLCSADAVQTSGNWGAAYNVGPSGTVITDLVEWKGELAACATDGMYMFDGVATSDQQLPLMGGIKDSDNGKNSLNWLGLILVPTKGGLLRWSYGMAAPKGPDSIFGYVEAEGVSNEPIHLQHFGLAYLEDWIYAAVYDGTNYHIIYGRPFGEGFRWDFLLTSSSAIKTLFVDSNARLWFGLANNLSSIQLRRSGAPTGGNYGEASLTGSFYTSEKVLADGANVRCRMAKVETDNNQTTLTWKLYSLRDGADAEQVGAAAGFKTDGEQKLYWTAASNLKARRLRYRLDFACSSFAPETTPPECLSFEFHGDALPDDADLIRAVVSLDSEGRSNKTVYDELAAHENAGVRKVRSPITDEILTVTIFRRELEWVKQRGTEPPKVGVMLYMRRGDVA